MTTDEKLIKTPKIATITTADTSMASSELIWGGFGVGMSDLRRRMSVWCRLTTVVSGVRTLVLDSMQEVARNGDIKTSCAVLNHVNKSEVDEKLFSVSFEASVLDRLARHLCFLHHCRPRRARDIFIFPSPLIWVTRARVEARICAACAPGQGCYAWASPTGRNSSHYAGRLCVTYRAIERGVLKRAHWPNQQP